MGLIHSQKSTVQITFIETVPTTRHTKMNNVTQSTQRFYFCSRRKVKIEKLMAAARWQRVGLAEIFLIKPQRAYIAIETKHTWMPDVSSPGTQDSPFTNPQLLVGSKHMQRKSFGEWWLVDEWRQIIRNFELNPPPPSSPKYAMCAF